MLQAAELDRNTYPVVPTPNSELKKSFLVNVFLSTVFNASFFAKLGATSF
jgi:hypothetical protein